MSASANLQVEGAVDTILFCATVGSVSESCEWMGEKDLQDVCEVGSHVSTGVRWIVFVYDTRRSLDGGGSKLYRRHSLSNRDSPTITEYARSREPRRHRRRGELC